MKFYSNGKLLITSEYLVLDGAKALAIPTKYGQSLLINVQNTYNKTLFWNSFDSKTKVWFFCDINFEKLKIISTSNLLIAKTLVEILKIAKTENKSFLINSNDIVVKTQLDFPKNWGLGTSSTLINNIASWANIDAFTLQFNIFGGSAYDIACAQNNSPIIYQLTNNKPLIKKVNFDPIFKANLFFVYLNMKQNSRDSIQLFNKNKNNLKSVITDITNITNQMINNSSLTEFEYLIQKHEDIIGNIIKTKPIQKRLFSDYFGQIKSLGAWGGDFILVTGNKDTIAYFNKKGYHTIIPFSKMIL